MNFIYCLIAICYLAYYYTVFKKKEYVINALKQKELNSYKTVPANERVVVTINEYLSIFAAGYILYYAFRNAQDVMGMDIQYLIWNIAVIVCACLFIYGLIARWGKKESIFNGYALVVIAGIIKLFFYDIFTIPSTSMYPTQKVNDLIITKVTKDFKRGDVAIFFPPKEAGKGYFTIFIKRLVGVPNDVIVHDFATNKDNVYQCSKDVANEMRKYYEKTMPLNDGEEITTALKMDRTTRDYTDFTDKCELISDEKFIREDDKFQKNMSAYIERIKSDPNYKPTATPIDTGNLIYLQKLGNVSFESAYLDPKISLGANTIKYIWLDVKQGEKGKYSLPAGVWLVDDGYYFMMGDNRPFSNDSRFWGQVEQSNVKFKYIKTLTNIKGLNENSLN